METVSFCSYNFPTENLSKLQAIAWDISSFKYETQKSIRQAFVKDKTKLKQPD